MVVAKIKTEAEFDSCLAKSKETGSLLVVDFSASWCGPCRMMEEPLEALSEANPTVTFVTVDVDEVSSVSRRCGISAMPTFHFYKAGEKVGEVVGADINAVKNLVISNL